MLTGSLDGVLRAATELVRWAARVAVVLQEPGLHRLEYAWIKRRCRIVIEVKCGHSFAECRREIAWPNFID